MNKTIKHLVVIGQQFQVNHILSKSVAVSYATRASLGWACMPRSNSRWIVIHRPYVKSFACISVGN